MIRLDKYLCEMQAGTRTEVKDLVKKGRVTVNGAVIKTADQKVNEESDIICLDGRAYNWTGLVYYMLHKPAGYVSATRDSREETILSLMQDAPGKDLFPVGRLDKDTEGLLLVTNDGALSHRLLSPKKHVDKTYIMKTALPVTEEMLKRLEEGLDIGDEKPTLPAKAELISEDGCNLKLCITEGRFHQVKRMLCAVGNEVLYLKRISMGTLILDPALEKGDWRLLTEKEKKDLGV